MFRGSQGVLAALAVIVSSLAAAGAAYAEAIKARTEACVGEPLGVACVEVDLPASEAPQPLGWQGLGIDEKRGRVLYPAVDSRTLAGAAKELLSDSRRRIVRVLSQVIEDRGRVKVYFLFTGQEPLDLTIRSQVAHELRITPSIDPAGWKRLRDAWWSQYRTASGFFLGRPSYPPVVENYLRAMLAKRLGLEPPAPPSQAAWQGQLVRELSLIADSESLRMNIERERFLGARPGSTAADQPLPRPFQAEPSDAPLPTGEATIEPLALRVPAECFYVRFGSFANFLWFQDMLERIGGDLSNLVASRGMDRRMRERMEMQLATQTTLASRFFGDAVVADVAIVGTDLFLQEGAAYGLLFQARTNEVLRRNFMDQRAQWKTKVPGAQETQVTIGGRDVSLLASPDGRVRSYYIADGDFHFITTSKALVRRFLEVRAGKGSLGQSPGFRHTRATLPADRKDTVFVCLSMGFFRNLLSPQHRIERLRRVEALADIDLVQMALLASAAEGRPTRTINELVAAGYLPPSFGPRPDGSRAVMVDDEVRDSLRGSKGRFVPIPDVETTRAAPLEVAAYLQLAEEYRHPWPEIDPLIVGIQRHSLGKDRDRITLDVRTTLLNKQPLSALRQFLGKADRRRIATLPENAVSFEIVRPQGRVFGALEGVGPGVEVLGGVVVPLGRLRDLLVGYIGATDRGGLLSWIPSLPSGPPDDEGYSRDRRGPWGRAVEPFHVYSFQREVLERVAPKLRLEDAEREAQLRLRVVDVSKSALAPLAHTWCYARTRQTALGNIQFMQQIVEQFRIPGDAARNTAEMLLDAKLLCPLGGQYVYRDAAPRVSRWSSTAFDSARRWSASAAQSPDGFQPPPLNWFRGLEADATVSDTGLSACVQLEMLWPKPGPTTAQRSE